MEEKCKEVVDLTGEAETECYSQELFSAESAESAESNIPPWQHVLHSSSTTIGAECE